MNVVLVMFKEKERRDFPLADPKTILGRRQDCQLRIPTRDVSRQHCEVVVNAKNITVKDLGSSNGTFVNGKRVAETELKAGDLLRIGPVTFTVQVDGKPAKIEPPKGAPVTTVSPTAAGAGEDEETFDLSDADFDADDPLSALDLDDEKDMP